MKYLRLISIFGLACLLLNGCNKESSIDKTSILSQKLFFQYEYINYAWGFQHQGWFIDSTGKVYSYNLPESDTWNSGDENGVISASDLNENLSKAHSTGYTINTRELASKIDLINKAKLGEISEPVQVGADAGAMIYSCYTYDSSTKSYKRVILKKLGDYRVDNNSKSAYYLYKWMESVKGHLVP